MWKRNKVNQPDLNSLFFTAMQIYFIHFRWLEWRGERASVYSARANGTQQLICSFSIVAFCSSSTTFMHLQQLPDVGSRLQCIIRLTNERALLKWHTPLTEQSFNDNNNYKSRTCMFAMKDNRSIRWKKLRWKMTGFSWRIVISTSTERKNLCGNKICPQTLSNVSQTSTRRLPVQNKKNTKTGQQRTAQQPWKFLANYTQNHLLPFNHFIWLRRYIFRFLTVLSLSLSQPMPMATN